MIGCLLLAALGVLDDTPEPRFSFSYETEEIDSATVAATPAQAADGWAAQVRTFDGGLKVTTLSRRFGKAVEWVNWLENTGPSDTKRISSFKDCDLRIPFAPDPTPKSRAFVTEDVQTVVYAHKGSVWADDEFAAAGVRAVDDRNRSRQALFQGGRPRHFSPVGGRSCDGTMPFFNVNRGNEGVVFAIGWSGQWACDLSRDEDGTVRIRTGLEDCDFHLKPGEKVRLSSIVVLPYSDGYECAQNAFRRLVKDHYSLIGAKDRPANGPMSLNLWGGVTSAELARRIDFAAKNRLGFEYAWVDAGWYGMFTTPSPNEFEGAWWPEAGDWRPNPNFHSDGMADVANAAHRNGMKFLLWFEIERSLSKSPVATEHPDWFLWPNEKVGPRDAGLIDLGNPAAWNWAYETLAGHIRRLGVDCYRQDFNMQPLGNWRHADAKDGRKGLHEVRHVMGLYRLWDALLAEFPGLIIDNCASGGRRIDIELCRRSIPLWRSDYQCPANHDPDIAQNHTRNLSLWLPYHGTAIGRIVGDTYRARSCYTGALGSNFIFSMDNSPDDYSPADLEWMRRFIAEYKRVRPFVSEDFYPLTPFATDKAAWCAMEFHSPSKRAGVILAFRRAESPFATGVFRLKGLDDGAVYAFEDADGAELPDVSGKQLRESGLELTMPSPRSARVIFFHARDNGHPARCTHTPETSKLFVPFVDPVSGVKSYLLKPGLIAPSHQTLYFNVKSMTDDGRFLVFVCHDNEYTGDGTGTRKPGETKKNLIAVVDFLKDEVIELDNRMAGFLTRLDTVYDRLYYVRKAKNPADAAICRRDLLDDPHKEIEVCKIPYELHRGKRVGYYCTHITLNGARDKAFMDSLLRPPDAKDHDWPGDEFVQGVIDLKTGRYESWGTTDFHCNHGQFNPKDDTLALCAWEYCWEEKGRAYQAKTGWYPRLWLKRADGSNEMVPARRANGASHEIWDEDGTGFSWCGCGVWHHDLATGRQEMFCPEKGAAHATLSADKRYVAYDVRVNGRWRGGPWRTGFWNRETDRGVTIFSTRPALGGSTGSEQESKLHPDPHPQFVCHDRYVCMTINNLDGHMDFLVTPVKELVERTKGEAWPVGKGPQTTATRVIDQFLAGRPEDYHPVGYRGNAGYGRGKAVQYSVVSLWANAIECARRAGDAFRLNELIGRYDDFKDGGKLAACRSKPYHVDDAIFGALPYAIYLANGDRNCLEQGNFYADTQWTPPSDATVAERHAAPRDEQEKYWAEGYTPQTRLWIDDMYMIIALQSQAFRATGDTKYIERAAKEMCLYLDKLQLKDGRAKGLFHHAPDAPFAWGRGNGWMAAGMALVLSCLPETSPHRAKILAGYRLMMETLAKYQRADGLWSQLVDEPDDPRNWGETSCTAMFAYVFQVGVRKGFLEAAEYAPRVRRAYLALVDRLDEYANVADVCIGTGKKNDRQYYFDRAKVNGDPHGQAPLLWLCAELAACASSSAEFADAKLHVQFETDCVTEANLAQFVADVKASQADAVQLALCCFAEKGEARARKLDWLGKLIKTFDDLGYPTAVWTSSLGYGGRLSPAEQERIGSAQKLVALDGQSHSTAVCPLDPALGDYLGENLRDFIRCGAKVVLYDDEWIQTGRGHICCVCPRHLALVERRLGRKVTVEEIRKSFTGAPNAVRTAFLDANGEASMRLARHLRAVADAVDPSVTLGVCATYTLFDIEGLDVDAFLTVLAGKGHRKLLRASGAPYWRRHYDRRYSGEDLDGILELVRMQGAWMKGRNVAVLDENDPYPRKTALVAPWATELYDKAIIADGNLVRNKYILRYDAKRSEPGYFDAHRANLADDAVLMKMFEGTESYGFRCVFPEHSIRQAQLPDEFIGENELLTRSSHPLAAHFLALNGIPVKHDGEGPCVAFGHYAASLDDAMMKRGVLLDLPAAKLLEKRGIDTGLSQTSQAPQLTTHVDAEGRRFAVLGIDGLALDYYTYRPRSHYSALRKAAAFFGLKDLCAVEGWQLYQIFKRDPKDGSIAVLVENLFDEPLDVRIATGRNPVVLQQLHGEFTCESDGLRLKGRLPPKGFLAVKFMSAPWASEWTEVTPQNGVWDDYYARTEDVANCSFKYRLLRFVDRIGVEAFVRDNAVVVDDCPANSISCETWKDDCLEVFFDGDNDRNPNTRGPDEANPLPCNAGGEYAIAANGSSQSDYASAKKCFGTLWGGSAEPWKDADGHSLGTHYCLWFRYECLNRPTPKPDEPVKFGFTICVHDDDDGGANDLALYWKGNPKIPYADESQFGQVELPGIGK